MQSNKTVLLGGAVIITVGFAKSLSSGGSPTRVFAGGVGVILLASLLELAGNVGNQLATGLVGVTTITVLLIEAPAVYSSIANGTKNAHNPFTGTAQSQSQNNSGGGSNTGTITGNTPGQKLAPKTYVKPVHGPF